MKTKKKNIEAEKALAKESLRDIHKLFKYGKTLTEEQLEKLCYILDYIGNFGLSGGSHSLGMAYLDFCFNNKLSDDEILMKIHALRDFINRTGKSPMSEEQLEYFVGFLQMGWEDVAIAYLDFCNNGGVSLKFSEKEESKSKPKQMTLTMQPRGEVTLHIAGTGTMTIDWGDDTPRETYTFQDFIDDDWWTNDECKYEYRHTYSDDSTRIITIAGEKIRYLKCEKIPLSNLDISRNTELTYLWCHDNLLTSLDISKSVALNELYCINNHLTSLDVSGNSALQNLYCIGCHLTSLDVSANTALEILRCLDNQLTGLDTGKNPALFLLDCSDNQLTYLDVSKNTALTDLSCSQNQLTSLDVSNNTALTSLHCRSNKLPYLDVSVNTDLVELYCSHNELTSLDISKNSLLKKLDCNGNKIPAIEKKKRYR